MRFEFLFYTAVLAQTKAQKVSHKNQATDLNSNKNILYETYGKEGWYATSLYYLKRKSLV